MVARHASRTSRGRRDEVALTRQKCTPPEIVMLPTGSGFPAVTSGEGGIRTLEGGLYPLNALAGRRLQPLGHFSERDQNSGRARNLRTGRSPESRLRHENPPMGCCQEQTQGRNFRGRLPPHPGIVASPVCGLCEAGFALPGSFLCSAPMRTASRGVGAPVDVCAAAVAGYLEHSHSA